MAPALTLPSGGEIRDGVETVTRSDRAYAQGGLSCALGRKRPRRAVCTGEVANSAGPVAEPRAFLARFEKCFSCASGSLFSYVPSLEPLDVTTLVAMSHSGQTIIYL